MPKLSDIQIDVSRFRGKGIRPWHDPNVVKTQPQKSTSAKESIKQQKEMVEISSPKSNQTVSKPLAEREQNVSKELAEPLAEPLAEREQTASKPLAKYPQSKNTDIIEILVGKEKNLLNFVFHKCQLSGSLISPPITTNELKTALKIRPDHLRNLIYRLLQKKILKIEYVKKGKAGWRKFLIPKEVFQSITLSSTVSKALAKSEQSVSKELAEPLATSSSSSSSSIYTNTTTTDKSKFSNINVLKNEWLEIDIEPLSEIGFTKNHLNQIATQNKLSSQATQDSIYAFAFDLQENNKAKNIKGDPLNFFMGILRNGRVYTFPSNYESPQDKSMRLYKERIDAIEERRAAIEKKATNLAFKEWFNKLSTQQKMEFLPRNMQKNTKLENSKMLEGTARTHFETEVWPTIRKEITEATTTENKTEK